MSTVSLAPLSLSALDEPGEAMLPRCSDINTIKDVTSKPSKGYAANNVRVQESGSLKENLEINTIPESVKTEDEADDVPSESDSEDDKDAAANVPRISAKRKADNMKFSAWLENRTAKVTKDEVQAVIENADEEKLSIRSLMAKQESNVIITDPREYQLELFEKAKKQNIIAVLDTGSGKTLIAVLLLKYMVDKELEDRAIGKKPRISFFLLSEPITAWDPLILMCVQVDCVTLVFQQFAVLECNLDQKIERFCGEMGCELWVKGTWRKHFNENMVIVCTAEILHQCLFHSFITIDEINLLIFDEAHHTKKNHAYARIIRDFYIPQGNPVKRPKIFGMTASPVDARVDVVKAAKDLESMLDCQIATTSDLSLLRMSISRPNESVAVYERLSHAYDTPLCSILRFKFGDLDSLSKIFNFAHEATSQLGGWCADQVWRFALAEEESRKVERKMERVFLRDQENRPMEMLDKELARLRTAQELVSEWKFPALVPESNTLSPKVALLHKYLKLRFEKPTDAKCIIFVKRRKTARLLAQLFKKIGTAHLRSDMLIGSGYSDIGDVKVSFRQQVLTLMRFRKGEVNCLFATSIAEEGLDIPDCNLVIRFDLYDTLIQYIQSRGRARHRNSKYLHMVEKDNRRHLEAVDDVRQGEKVMRQFCEALPADRLLEGNDDSLGTILAKEKGQRKYTDPETGAVLNYGNSLTILAHFVGSLPHHNEVIQQVTYAMSTENKKFVCEVILTEGSPIHSATGRPCSRKSIAKRSAAFEACLILREKGFLDNHLLPIYHKYLPQMRNAQLALTSKQSNSYLMKIKPSLWEQTRGSIPGRLYLTVIELEKSEDLGRPCQPLALLTREKLPDFPPFLLYLQIGKPSNVLCKSLPQSFTIDAADLSELTQYTLCLYKDIFNKDYENNEPEMDYWLAPMIDDWKKVTSKQPTNTLLDWMSIKHVAKDFRSPEDRWWTMDTPHDQLINRYLVDRFDGGRRFFSVSVDPELRPLDPIPGSVDLQKKEKRAGNILEYSVSLWNKSKAKNQDNWRKDQPVMRAERLLYRLNWLDDFTEKEKLLKTRSYLCPQPFKFSALPISMVSMTYLFPAVISRLEAYLIALEACDLLGLSVKPELALEAITKDSDNTEEHKNEQIHLQRGMGKNYERLEFIGDCFLKMATSITLFSTAPDNDEYEYHVRRMLMICNKNLLGTALNVRLYEYIRSQSFSRRLWYPQGIKLVEGSTSRGYNAVIDPKSITHKLGDKTVADVCEALIGAALISSDDPGNMDMAVKAVTALVSNEDHNVTKWADYYPLYTKPKYQLAHATASQLDLAMQVERIHGYHFKYPRLLRSAFIHPSYTFAAEKIPCYQRLEFLGDALLDMASISFLFHRHPDRDPQWLTEHKMAMVSNKFLAALSVRLGFHRHMRSNGTVIELQNREYVTEIQEAEKEAKGARDYWTNTKQPPKALSDVVESYIGAIFVDSEYNYKEVERFFGEHIRWFFEDMSVYDTFANNHPTTYLHNRMTLSFGCTNYRLMASEIPSIIPGGPVTSIAGVMIHGEVIAEGQASSGKNAKIKASSNALKLLQGLAPFEFRQQYHCNCDGEQKSWVGEDGNGVGMVGSAI